MKKLFNNPWVIACLGICSLVYLGFSIAGPLMEQEAQASSLAAMEMPGMPGNPEELLSFRDEIPTRNLEKANISWLDALNRDPFGAATGVSGDQASVPVAPHLDAIFSGENTHMAVVDQQLVREGDTVRGYRVMAIKRTQVILSRNGDQLTLEAQL